MANEIFVDSGGFYSILVKGDDAHLKAKAVLDVCRTERRRFVTTDYVLDETATLLKARGHMGVAPAFFETLHTTQAVSIEWTDSERFAAVQAFFLKHSDKKWSFTDCLSFMVMRERGLTEALAKDIHYRQAGFVPLLI